MAKERAEYAVPSWYLGDKEGILAALVNGVILNGCVVHMTASLILALRFLFEICPVNTAVLSPHEDYYFFETHHLIVSSVFTPRTCMTILLSIMRVWHSDRFSLALLACFLCLQNETSLHVVLIVSRGDTGGEWWV
jgi:hypothetical protein